jgi:hypothetical protein
MSDANHEDLSLAIRSVRAAASLLRSKPQGKATVDAIIGREWKVRADRDLEAVILQVLMEGSKYPVLTEESGHRAGVGERQWLVDPRSDFFVALLERVLGAMMSPFGEAQKNARFRRRVSFAPDCRLDLIIQSKSSTDL